MVMIVCRDYYKYLLLYHVDSYGTSTWEGLGSWCPDFFQGK